MNRVRLTVVIAAAITAGYAYPWQSGPDRWVLGVAAAVVAAALVRWRGRHLTTLLTERLRIALRGKRISVPNDPAATTVLLRIEDGEPPTDLLTGYLERYGLRCESIRITTRSTPGRRAVWIGLRFSAAQNLAALQARSPQIPLHQTARNTGRRLIEQLAEQGVTATLVDSADVPDLVADDARERWRSVTDSRGHLTAYGDSAIDPVPHCSESWSVVEISGTPTHPRIRSALAIRTESTPVAIPGAVALTGRQAAALAALHPLSGSRLLN
ncbi:type VII secretion protein EccE [Mycobacterium sp. M26]|uniref:type VII secretion protein EccE n=1 Tax=Mycobacterium sp. M26 TaxID=1762962 RepID=UPI00073E6854|nr:type VII secretion protein EccE [Mycobacterium sp. M26]